VVLEERQVTSEPTSSPVRSIFKGRVEAGVLSRARLREGIRSASEGESSWAIILVNVEGRRAVLTAFR
jgi:hypothetical protein